MNGGGQIRDEQTNSLSKELLLKVEKVYNSVKNQIPDENTFVKNLYDSIWLGKDNLEKNLYTNYHEIEKNTNGLAIKW